MGFPTNPNDGDEYTNALGTKYKYLDADHKWYIITGFGAGDLLHNDLDGLNAGDVYEHISAAQLAALHTRLHTITNVLDHSANNHKIFYSDGSGHIIELAFGADGTVLTSTGAATAPAFEAAGGGNGGPFYQNIACHGSSGATPGGYWFLLDAVGERISVTFTTGADWDDSEDLVITFSWQRNDAGGDTVAFKVYGKSVIYDGTEDVKTFNLDSATPISLAACAIDKGKTYSYTIAAVDWTAGEGVTVMLNHNEGVKSLYFTTHAKVIYYRA